MKAAKREEAVDACVLEVRPSPGSAPGTGHLLMVQRAKDGLLGGARTRGTAAGWKSTSSEMQLLAAG